MAAKFGLFGDRAFSQICQFWLHEYTRNVQLGNFCINSEHVFNKEAVAEQGSFLTIWHYKKEPNGTAEFLRNIDIYRVPVRVPYAEVPLPANIMALKWRGIELRLE
jgi:hypothetical protein